jgi:hypothetical protein
MNVSHIKGKCLPLSPQPERDVNFLRDIYNFGWYNHKVAAIILYDRIANIEHYYCPGKPEEFNLIIEIGRAQQILRVKIIAEYIALLEAFGYLCIAIRDRASKSMIWTYMNTEPRYVAEFYDKILSYPKLPNLIKLLKLPTLSQVKEAAESHPKICFPELEELENEAGTYRRLVQNIHFCAELYNKKLSIYVALYNKIKHCFPILEGMDWISPVPNKAVVMVKIDAGTGLGYWPVDMSQEKVDEEMKNINIVTNMGSELLAVCVGLHQLGILFQAA